MSNDADSLLSILAKAAEGNQRELMPKVLRMASELVRSRLDPADAEVIAGWLDRLAAGHDPRAVFGTNEPGRPRKTAAGGPDDIDIAWLVRQAHLGGLTVAEAKRRVARALRMEARTVANIYSRYKAELGPPPA